MSFVRFDWISQLSLYESRLTGTSHGSNGRLKLIQREKSVENWFENLIAHLTARRTGLVMLELTFDSPATILIASEPPCMTWADYRLPKPFRYDDLLNFLNTKWQVKYYVDENGGPWALCEHNHETRREAEVCPYMSTCGSEIVDASTFEKKKEKTLLPGNPPSQIPVLRVHVNAEKTIHD
jgi:hypothetical protein